jgi:hypothetical protein
MAACKEDPVVCIDWLATAIGDFLKDGITMTCLAVLLVLLLRARARSQQRALEAYASSMLDYEQGRGKGKTWSVGKNTGEPGSGKAPD